MESFKYTDCQFQEGPHRKELIINYINSSCRGFDVMQYFEYERFSMLLQACLPLKQRALLISERSRCSAGLFFEKMIEMCRLFKTQAITDFRNVPVGMFQ